jgi:hypothetical protein
MIDQFLVLAIDFSIRCVFLFIGLWAMIKIQRLDWNFLGLLGSAAIGSGLDMIPFVGHYLAVLSLWLCLKKVTNADLFPDVAFTVAIGYALVFCMNLFLLASLMGDLRPSARHSELAKEEMDASSDDEPETDEALEATTATNVVAAPPQVPVPADRPKGQSATKSAREIAGNFSVDGVIEGSGKPTALVNSGMKTYPLVTGETRSMETKDGKVAARFDGLRDHQVLLTISGEQVALSYK